MILQKLKAKNFLSYQELKIEFDKKLCLINGWNHDEDTANGAGKTTILDAICFALFGEIPRGVKVDEIINRKAKKECIVQLYFSIGEDNYTITRSRKPNTLAIKKGNKEIVGKDLKETQQLIEQIIKIDFNIFTNSVYFTQNAKSRFISATDNEKKDILTQILDLSIFDRAYDNTNKSLRLLKEGLDRSEVSKEHAERDVRELSEDIDSHKIKQQEFQTDRDKKAESFKNKIPEINNDIKELTDDIDSFKSRQINIMAELSNIEKKLQIKDQVTETYQQLKEDRREKSIESKNIRDRIEKLTDKKEGECSECFSVVTEDHLKKEIAKAVGELNKRKPELDEIKNNEEKYRQVVEKIGDLEESKTKLNYEFDSLKMKVSNWEGKIDLHRSHLKALDDDVQRVLEEDNVYDQLIEEHQGKLKIKKRKLDEINGTIKITGDMQTKLEALKKAYKNVKYYVFETVTDELNLRIDKYLEPLFKNNMKVQLKTESTNSKKEVIQKFSTYIEKNEVEVSFNSLSDGEKRRVEIAVNFALSDVISNSASSINLLVLDEIFNGLDTVGRNQIVYLLDMLRSEKENIFIIDHFETTKSLVNNTIEVELRDGISKII